MATDSARLLTEPCPLSAGIHRAIILFHTEEAWHIVYNTFFFETFPVESLQPALAAVRSASPSPKWPLQRAPIDGQQHSPTTGSVGGAQGGEIFSSFTERMAEAPPAGDRFRTKPTALPYPVYHFTHLTCCTVFGAFILHAGNSNGEWYVSDGLQAAAGPDTALSVVLTNVSDPYSEEACASVVDRHTFVFLELSHWGSFSHFLMEFLPSLFFTIAMVADQDGLPFRPTQTLLIRNRGNFPSSYAPAPSWQRELLAAFSDLPAIEFAQLLATVHFHATDYQPTEGVPTNAVCFRHLVAYQSYTMVLDDPERSANADRVANWHSFRSHMWATFGVDEVGASCRRSSQFLRGSGSARRDGLQRLLILRRLHRGGRRLLNHHEVEAALLDAGWAVSSVSPDLHDVAFTADAAYGHTALLAINSGSYNAVFMRTGSCVVEIAPRSHHHMLGQSESQRLTFTVGLAHLGVHHVVYACFPKLYPRLLLEAPAGSAPRRRDDDPIHLKPIVLRPQTVVFLLDHATRIGKTAGCPRRALGSPIQDHDDLTTACRGSYSAFDCLAEDDGYATNWTRQEVPWAYKKYLL